MSRYELIESIGEGGMGVVYRARQLPLGRVVAVKFMSSWGRGTDLMVKRFHREIMTASGVHHPNVVKIFDSGEQDGIPYFSMELVRGDTLKHLIRNRHREVLRQSGRILHQILDALTALHEAGIVHRDIKSANVMLDDRGHVTLMDFGLAKNDSEQQTVLTEQGRLVGTPGYIPPEMFMGHPASPAADIWAVGVLYYEILTGDLPYRGDTPIELARSIVGDPVPDPRSAGAPVDDRRLAFLGRCMEKDPARRFAGGREAFEAFREMLQGPGEGPDPSGPWSGEPAVGVEGAGEAGAQGGPASPSRRTTARRITARSGPGVVPADSTLPPVRRWLPGAGLILALGMGCLALLAVGQRRTAGVTGPPAAPASGTGEPARSPPASPGGTPRETAPERLRRALFRLRPRVLHDEFVKDWERVRDGSVQDRGRLDAASARWRDRLDREFTAVDLARTLQDAARFWHPGPSPPAGPGSEPSGSSPTEIEHEGYFYQEMTWLTRLVGACQSVGIPVPSPDPGAYPPRHRPLLVDPGGPGESVVLAWDRAQIKELRTDRPRQTLVIPGNTGLLLWVPGASVRQSLVQAVQDGKEPDRYVHPAPLPLRREEPGEVVVLETYSRWLTPGEWFEVSFSPDGKSWSDDVILIDMDDRDSRQQRFHRLRPGLVVGPSRVRIRYRYPPGLGLEGDALLYYLAIHYLRP